MTIPDYTTIYDTLERFISKLIELITTPFTEINYIFQYATNAIETLIDYMFENFGFLDLITNIFAIIPTPLTTVFILGFTTGIILILMRKI